MTHQINLYDPSLLRRRELFSADNLALAAAALMLIIGILGGWLRVAAAKLDDEAAVLEPQVKNLRDQLATLGQEAATRKPDARVERELEDTRARLASRTEILSMLQKGLGPEAVSFAEYLRGFGRQTPAGLWLTGFTVEGDGSGMEIQGRTINPALIPEYIRRLNGEKAFKGRAFAALQLNVPSLSAAGSSVTAAASRAPDTPRYHEFSLKPIEAAGLPATTSGGATPSVEKRQ